MNFLIGKKIIIYGAGKVGQDYYMQISKYERCEIMAWVDVKWKEISFEYAKVVHLKEALKKPYDNIIVAVYDKKTAMEVRKDLVLEGVFDKKIIWEKPKEYFSQ